MAIIKNDQERAAVRKSGKILAAALRETAAAVRPGRTTRELDAIAESYIRAADATPSFLGFQGYPAALCVSINDEVVHGIPSDRVLQDGDTISLDLGVIYDRWFTDAALTMIVGQAPARAKKLVARTHDALEAAIAAARVGQHIGDIGAAVQRVIEPTGFGIVQQLCGHGVGRAVHEAPQIPNVGRPGAGPLITTGMVLAIEPMITLGDPTVHTAADGWTVLTDDGSLAAHWEHTVLITPDGPEVLTA